MSAQKYVWKGPATVIELWDVSASQEKKLTYSGFVTTGFEIPQALDSDRPEVMSWVNFGWLEPIADNAAKTRGLTTSSPRTKENADG